MQILFFIVMALLLGAITPIYLSMNSSVARYVDSPTLANISFFLVGLTVATGIVAAIALINLSEETEGILATAQKFTQVPPQYYLSGAFSAMFVLGTTALLPRLGANVFFVTFVTGQIVMATIISHFGILESPHDPISVRKVVGISLVITGLSVTTLLKDFSWVPGNFRNLISFWST